MNLNNKSLLITGGTGSFGRDFISSVINKNLKKIIIFSRDELKQYEIKENLKNHKNFTKLRFFLGDIRDFDRIKLASKNVDIIVHAAALKQVDTAEYNPTEFIKTNIIGSENIIRAAFENKIKKVVALSTDKASSPINLYGASKLCSDKLFISANFFLGLKIFTVVRYGNVEGSRGSIIPVLLKQKKNKRIVITDKRMTRFSLSLSESVKLVLWAIKFSKGSEVIIPKIPSYKIIDLVNAINSKAQIDFSGIRPGEKIDEEMFSSHDSHNALELKDKYIILPNFKDPPHTFDVNNIKKYYKKKFLAKNVIAGFNYNSKQNKKFLSISELKKIIYNFEKKI